MKLKSEQKRGSFEEQKIFLSTNGEWIKKTEKCTKNLGFTLKQACGLYKARRATFTALVHGWLAGINAQKTCFFVLPELGALSYYDLHIGKQKEQVIHFLLDVSYNVIEPFPRKLVNVLS